MKMRVGIVVALAFAALVAIGCRKSSPPSNARCRLFEQDPGTVEDQSTLEELRAAYEDVQLAAECARAARQSVEEWSARHRLPERLDDVGRRIEAAGHTLLDEAQNTIHQAKTGAERALQQGAERAQEAAKALQDLAGGTEEQSP